jgi:A/G-specific adenine glycosylase
MAQRVRAVIEPAVLTTFQQELLAWYAAEGRDLPWRRTSDPYAILVSEIMLQQTQVRTVVPYYERFLARFPTLAALAAAPLAEVKAITDPLGYKVRGERLKRIAETAMERYGGTLPRSEEELLALPGIGRYTAGAIRSFAFREDAPILDTNVLRLLVRVFAPPRAGGGAALLRRLWALAEAVIPPGQGQAHLPVLSAAPDLRALELDGPDRPLRAGSARLVVPCLERALVDHVCARHAVVQAAFLVAQHHQDADQVNHGEEVKEEEAQDRPDETRRSARRVDDPQAHQLLAGREARLRPAEDVVDEVPYPHDRQEDDDGLEEPRDGSGQFRLAGIGRGPQPLEGTNGWLQDDEVQDPGGDGEDHRVEQIRGCATPEPRAHCEGRWGRRGRRPALGGARPGLGGGHGGHLPPSGRCAGPENGLRGR